MARRDRLSREQEAERARRALLRRASLYTVGFAVAAIVVAAAGAALIALLLRLSGLPFLETWLALFGIVLVAAGVALVVQRLRERRGRSSG